MLKIRVTVKPQARKEELRKIAEGEYLVSVHPPAREGKANRAMIEILAAHFSVAKTAVRIVRGASSRKKLVEIG